MFKKMFIVTIMFVLVTPFCFANNNPTAPSPNATSDKKIIGIFLNAPATYLSNEDTKKSVQEKVEKIFPANAFVVLPLDKTISESRTYRENNKMTTDQKFATEDIQQIAMRLNCNYVLRITIANSSPKIEIEFPSVSSVSDITCDIGFLNVASGQYLTALEIINKGKKAATLDFNVSFDKQYDTTIDKALKALEIDVTSL